MAAPLSDSPLFLDANLVSYWKMDGNSNDSKGSNNGTDTNITYGAGKFGQSAGFAAASTSKIAIAGMALNYTHTTAFSWGFWLNPSDTTTGYIMDSNVSPGAGALFVDINKDAVSSGKLTFEIGKSGTGVTQLTSSTSYVTGEWEFYVATHDGANNMKLYRNGVSVGTATYSNGAATSTGSGLYLGYASNNSNYITGNMDDVFVFSDELTSTEILTLYNLVVGGGSPISFGNTAIA